MNYELAKELNDARFPLNPNRRWDLSDFYWNPETGGARGAREKIWIPTLEELIEACGDIKLRLQKIGDMWVADDKDAVTENYAPTPTEAVARLWLSLNKKS